MPHPPSQAGVCCCATVGGGRGATPESGGLRHAAAGGEARRRDAGEGWSAGRRRDPALASGGRLDGGLDSDALDALGRGPSLFGSAATSEGAPVAVADAEAVNGTAVILNLTAKQ